MEWRSGVDDKLVGDLDISEDGEYMAMGVECEVGILKIQKEGVV